MIFFNIHDFLSNLEMNDAGPRATGSLQQTVTVTAGYSDSAREAAIGLRRPESLEIMMVTGLSDGRPGRPGTGAGKLARDGEMDLMVVRDSNPAVSRHAKCIHSK